jgi:hypothetical protein
MEVSTCTGSLAVDALIHKDVSIQVFCSQSQLAFCER